MTGKRKREDAPRQAQPKKKLKSSTYDEFNTDHVHRLSQMVKILNSSGNPERSRKLLHKHIDRIKDFAAFPNCQMGSHSKKDYFLIKMHYNKVEGEEKWKVSCLFLYYKGEKAGQYLVKEGTTSKPEM